MSLGRKQRITNEAWLEAVATVESAVSEAALGELVAATIEDIKAKTAGKKAAYAWSGGKDSIVLGKLCEAAGVVDSMIGVCDLEYPAFAAWIEEHKPAGCEVINTHQDIDWLVKHQEMLFPNLLILSRIVKQFTAPLTTLTDGLNQFASGDLTTQIDIHSHDELEVLGDTFNTMVVRIHQLAGSGSGR